MTDYKEGDEVWTWSLTVYGGYLPFFTKYKITEIVQSGTYIFACLSHDRLCDMSMPIDLIFNTKNEAIDAMINLLETLKDA